ncbi:C4-dicarboxylate TRAP transporter substrate-binding protein [Granulosicoccus antarcticus]|uniref:Solute-binding protein n=1 Tax=Granulosicoccus antarcticus IMCC3135 TaxID=1192854 RepID=A0A2Z2NVC5_9GAMM|nr:C4-dicarboxylate TRAP transporter substrate-binding protein [Granulosicoccus antarcticus]ASJ72740.1 Solute-binding protein [Granulosicoccus antarcticus IMCC3135]
MKIINTILAGAVLTGSTLMASPAFSDSFTFRIGSGHPKGPAPYVTTMSDFFAVEVEKRVAEQTEHKVKFIEAYGGSIASVADTLESVQQGILDFGGYCVCFETSKLFLHNFPYYLAFGPQKSSDAIAAARQVYDENPWLEQVMEDEYNQVFLGLGTWDNYHLGTKEEWDTTADLKGIKIGGAGPNLPWLEYVEAIPVQSTLPEGYLALKTGVYTGWLMTPSAYNGFKLYEPAPYYTLIGFGAMPVIALTANKAKMESLPEDVRNIIVEVGAEWEAQNGAIMDDVQNIGLTKLKENGAIIKTLPEEVRVEWAESLVDFPKRQVADAESRGLPGQKVMKSYLEAAKTVGHQWPVEYDLE